MHDFYRVRADGELVLVYGSGVDALTIDVHFRPSASDVYTDGAKCGGWRIGWLIDLVILWCDYLVLRRFAWGAHSWAGLGGLGDRSRLWYFDEGEG